MRENNLEYASEKVNDTRGADGCIDLLIANVKRELVKNIKGRSRASHGYRVTITKEKGQQVTKRGGYRVYSMNGSGNMVEMQSLKLRMLRVHRNQTTNKPLQLCPRFMVRKMLK